MRRFGLIFCLIAMSRAIWGEVKVDFENDCGYKSLGVYDVWEESPFRTGELKGNYAIVANPDVNVERNNSVKVLGAQRSRFGSNRFGVRVDLESPLALSPDTLYCHVLLHKPKDGRVMLVGLGSRKERLGQNPYTEQFYELSRTPVKPGEWCDAVFPLRGAEGVEIRSLVLVPDCESPHELKEDFLFYIDDIEINKDPSPRFQIEYEIIAEDSSASDIAIVNDNQLNGEVVAADGTKLNSLEVPAGKDFRIKVEPEKGFRNGGIYIRFGHKERFIPASKFDAENCYTIPGEFIQGEVLILGNMVEEK